MPSSKPPQICFTPCGTFFLDLISNCVSFRHVLRSVMCEITTCRRCYETSVQIHPISPSFHSSYFSVIGRCCFSDHTYYFTANKLRWRQHLWNFVVAIMCLVPHAGHYHCNRVTESPTQCNAECKRSSASLGLGLLRTRVLKIPDALLVCDFSSRNQGGWHARDNAGDLPRVSVEPSQPPRIEWAFSNLLKIETEASRRLDTVLAETLLGLDWRPRN